MNGEPPRHLRPSVGRLVLAVAGSALGAFLAVGLLFTFVYFVTALDMGGLNPGDQESRRAAAFLPLWVGLAWVPMAIAPVCAAIAAATIAYRAAAKRPPSFVGDAAIRLAGSTCAALIFDTTVLVSSAGKGPMEARMLQAVGAWMGMLVGFLATHAILLSRKARRS